jgi:hypothetical protein
MLQIITGKFYKMTARHENPGKGILFSNFRSSYPIETVVGKLESVADSGSNGGLIFSYLHQLEVGPDPYFSIVRGGGEDAELIEQFRLLAIFGLRAWFSHDQSRVEHLCRSTRKGQTREWPPSKFVPRYFEPNLEGRLEDVAEFAALVKKTVALPRFKYLAVLGALRAIAGALEAVSGNVDLAYSMLVYALESLAQQFDGHEPQWEEYEPAIRTALDTVLAKATPEVAAEIRTALLCAGHVKLQARFIAFITAHVEERYFTSEAARVRAPVQKNSLKRVLANAYNLRSRYVHALEPVLHQLRQPELALSDALEWNHKPYLTFSGLLRLTTHIVRNFIARGQVLETEDIDWRNQLPGIVKWKMAPEYWLRPEKFTPGNAVQFLEGFIEHLYSPRDNNAVVDMTGVMEIIEQRMSHAKKEEKVSMVSLYLLWNYTVSENLARTGYHEFLAKHATVLDEASIEFLAASVGLDSEWRHPLDALVTTFRRYTTAKFNPLSLSLPRIVEAAIASKIANRAIDDGKLEIFREMLDFARLNLPGCIEIQQQLSEAMVALKRVDVFSVLGRTA